MENQEYKKMVLRLDAGCAGTDSAEFWLVPVDVTQQQLDDLAWERVVDHTDMYDIYPESERPDDWDEDEHDSWRNDSYSDNIEGGFEDYDPKKHDGLRVGNDESWREW